ncbi:IS5/IS1182 family transposase, partial [Streptomyces sp. NPDC056723]
HRHRPVAGLRGLFGTREAAGRSLLSALSRPPPAARRPPLGLGEVRWVVERAFAWRHRFKGLRIRYERRADLHPGLLELGCGRICLRRLRTAG